MRRDLWQILGIDGSERRALPSPAEAIAYLRQPRPSAERALKLAHETKSPLVQPRCGVGHLDDMRRLLQVLDRSHPGMLSLTIDSYTRLLKLDVARKALQSKAQTLNGYPLVAHGWCNTRELLDHVNVPLQVRHGSPDGRRLFAETLASGISSYEGGGIGYNIPYCKNVPLAASLRNWMAVDEVCGLLAQEGVIIDREFFGSLTAVLMPPSISMACVLLEAKLAESAGAPCLSLAIPQSGNIYQDVASLNMLRVMASRYLDCNTQTYIVMHAFMGSFPLDRDRADQLIVFSGITGQLGAADKIISKTNEEALGVPTTTANADGIRLTKLGSTALCSAIRLDPTRLAYESELVSQEVEDLITPVLEQTNLSKAIIEAFAAGRLDVPFSASSAARGAVIPMRDTSGAVRISDFGSLPYSSRVRKVHRELLSVSATNGSSLERVAKDIAWFADGHAWAY